jgi:hypothetical protein
VITCYWRSTSARWRLEHNDNYLRFVIKVLFCHVEVILDVADDGSRPVMRDPTPYDENAVLLQILGVPV